MSTPLLATKLYIPPPKPGLINRPRLMAKLNAGLHTKLTLVSAPAGFGKTTLVSSWLSQLEGSFSNSRTAASEKAATQHEKAPVQQQAVWLSLDEGDRDLIRFLRYLVAAFQTLAPAVGHGVAAQLQSPQPPPWEALLTSLLNELATLPEQHILVLDDFHVVDAVAVEQALAFLLEHLPPHLHLVMTTREDPNLPLARLRVRGALTEIRAADLRFTPDEVATLLNDVLGLNLTADEVAALEARTEGWIAGLQLAALSLQGQPTAAAQHRTAFIQSFTGSHRFVMDYLVEEVLAQQPAHIQTFLLYTSILDRLCGPLCDALLGRAGAEEWRLNDESSPIPPSASQVILERLEQANLFLVPLDNERCWYRYHHLFADLLRQRLRQQPGAGDEQQREARIALLHRRASQWYEEAGFELEAFHHAVAADDVPHAARLVQGDGMPLHFRGAITPVLNWLASLPIAVLNTDPALWVTYASVVTMTGQPEAQVEEKLRAAEALLPTTAADERPADPQSRDLVGQIAAIRAMLGIPQGQADLVLAQSQRALDTLHPHNLPVRTGANWTLGFAHQLQGNRRAAARAYADTLAISRASGNVMMTIAATICLGQVHESDLDLALAIEQHQAVLTLTGNPPWPTACEAHLGLARINYALNNLDAAQQHAQQSLPLAQQLANVGTPVSCWLLLTRIHLARNDGAGAAQQLSNAETFARQQNFLYLLPDIAAVRVLLLLQQGAVAEAAQLVEQHELPLIHARVQLAQGDPAGALTRLAPLHQQMAERGWRDELLQVTLLEALAQDAQGDGDAALARLREALVLAEGSGVIRPFVDEGAPMAALLQKAAARQVRPIYTAQLLAALGATSDDSARPLHAAPPPISSAPIQSLIEPLSERELEVLHLIAQGLSNREIGERLYIALDTVKGHNRNIFGKLQVQRRTEAIARARALGLL